VRLTRQFAESPEALAAVLDLQGGQDSLGDGLVHLCFSRISISTRSSSRLKSSS
jgi:hypothetical protein